LNTNPFILVFSLCRNLWSIGRRRNKFGHGFIKFYLGILNDFIFNWLYSA
jgi:hypothetical protein